MRRAPHQRRADPAVVSRCASCGGTGHRAGECCVATRELSLPELGRFCDVLVAELVNACLAESWPDARRVAFVLRRARARLARASD
jgi:hypothetical protein